MTKEELEKIESIVNEKIWADIPVQIEQKPISEAKEMGAMALFGEKYGDIVRVVSVGDYSIELCGGCHVPATSTIGLFKIESEGGIGAGTRRIEAVTGQEAYHSFKQEEALLTEAAALLKSNPKDLVTKVGSFLSEMKELQRENESLSSKLGNSQLTDILANAQQIDDVTVVSARVDVKDNNALRQMIDELKQKVSKAVIVLGAAADGKVLLASGVTEDLKNGNFHAGKIVNHVASLCGGKGGGRPDMAMAGAKDASKLDEALHSVYDYVKSV